MSFPKYPEYKDSGVEWFGEIPSHWEAVPFKWHLQRNDGGVWGEDPQGDEGIIVLRSTDQTVDGHWRVSEPAKRSLTRVEALSAALCEGDLVVTKSSGSEQHIGKTTLVSAAIERMRCCFGNFMQRLRVSDSFLPRLAWYFLNSDLARRQLHLLSNTTTGLANLNGTLLGELLLVVPPRAEQGAIVAFLDHETGKIDALIEEQRRLIELLKEKRQAVISHAVTKGLDPNVPMKDSGVEWLGEVPEHWDVAKLKYLISSFEQGWSPQCENVPRTSSDEWAVLKVGCVNHGRFSPEENKLLPDTLNPNPELSVKEGDILVSRANTRELVGSAALVDSDYPGLMISDKLFRVRTDTSVSPEWLTLYLNTDAVRPEIEVEATGASSSMLNIGQGVLKELWVPVAPPQEQVEIVEWLNKTLSELEDLRLEVEAALGFLGERRSALISAAVTGKIDVRGWAGAAEQEEPELPMVAEEQAGYSAQGGAA